ncbi:hypothetical protein OBBRIDRAFT_334587 [Obba rivulosa]|uniref:Uncharacterized protein n=1 Tax=Obba rivulosa TaxID=1052685 RepID=A0A8E2ANP1_9APHY|nr:hypothetical protein OBBRIDRAFT_334587 [Obba rivulosa]
MFPCPRGQPTVRWAASAGALSCCVTAIVQVTAYGVGRAVQPLPCLPRRYEHSLRTPLIDGSARLRRRQSPVFLSAMAHRSSWNDPGIEPTLSSEGLHLSRRLAVKKKSFWLDRLPTADLILSHRRGCKPPCIVAHPTPSAGNP